MNSIGNIFRVQIFGESHGEMIGVGIDGIPPGISILESDFLADLERRKPKAKGTTPRKEPDTPIIKSGVFNGKTTGAPIFIEFENTNANSNDYKQLVKFPRPGHSDFVAHKKYKGFNDYRGGGHFSGRLTLALISAGVIAKKIIPEISIRASILEVGGEKEYENLINEVLKEGDSVGGLIECRCSNIPIGLGEPFFKSIESYIAQLVFSIPAVKGIEFGSGFKSAAMKGSEHNDLISNASGTTASNNAGGINGGISNGNDIVFRVAIKPSSSISKKQNTYNFENDSLQDMEVKGRHDACIALRVPVVLEAAAALALCDFYLMSKTL